MMHGRFCPSQVRKDGFEWLSEISRKAKPFAATSPEAKPDGLARHAGRRARTSTGNKARHVLMRESPRERVPARRASTPRLSPCVSARNESPGGQAGFFHASDLRVH